MQQAASGAFWQELGGVGGFESRCRREGSGALKVMTRSLNAEGMQKAGRGRERWVKGGVVGGVLY
jgi:hypothetical protein